MSDGSSGAGGQLGDLAPGLAAVCGSYLDANLAQLRRGIEDGAGGVQLARNHADAVDGLMGSLFCAAEALVRARGCAPAGPVALVAVGSYGRRELCLHSDTDVIVICDDPGDPGVGPLVEAFLYPLWDVGLKVGHSVRGVDDMLALARDDLSTATSLLDVRRIAGDRRVVDELGARGRAQLSGPGRARFLSSLEADTEARHERFGGSLYLLEPELKLGRGGLRDLDMVRWAARARWDGELHTLVGSGALGEREHGELLAARDMLWKVRSLLHLRARRAQDRLTFEDQEEIATRLGFVNGVTLAVEQFMQAYYRHARVVAGVGERVLRRVKTRSGVSMLPAAALPQGVIEVDGELGLQVPDALRDSPELAFQFYEGVLHCQRPPMQEARDAIMELASDGSWSAELRKNGANARAFCRLLTHAPEVAPLRRKSILGELHEVGLLLAMIPEFEPVTGRVQHDVYHIYTVDVHSIAAIDRLRALMRGDAAGELGLCSRMAAETVRHLPLFLGLLLHDIGKAHGRDHARQGAIMARPIAERLGLSPIDVDHVVWLVQEHLSLYHWATRRDTSDPTTIREVATQVGAPDRLRDLYLLTFADLSTTNPKAMTDWKARMLDELYFGVASHLEGKSPDMRRRARDLRDEARVGFVGDAGQQELEAFVDGMPERYLLAHPVDVIRRHARAARGRTDKRVHVALSPGSSEDVTELLVLMDDRAGLLSEVSIALTVNRLEITAAQVYARERPKGPPEAVDLLQVRRSGRHVDHIEQSELDQLARDIEDLVENRVSVEEIKKRMPSLPKWAAPRGPSVPTRVVIDNEASSRYTVVDVYAHDHPGLLHDIARVLSEENLTIGMAKVNTEGLKAADVFYVEREGGGKLSDPMQAEALRARLHASIDAASVN